MIESEEDVRENAEILKVGRWYIAELEEPPLAMQGESEEEAVDKLVSRWEKYTAEPAKTEFGCTTLEFRRDILGQEG